MKKSDLVSIADLTPNTLLGVLRDAAALKRDGGGRTLAGRSVALLFQKPSLRTRASFDVAVHQLGGHCLYLGPEEVGLGEREPVEDVARVLSRYVDAMVARTFFHRDVELLARYATVPVVNGLSDVEHPCQALADLLTIQEKSGRLDGRAIGYVGDGNNCAASLALGAAMTGAAFRIASPPGYELPEPIARRARSLAAATEAPFEMVRDPLDAIRGADVVYTDAWTSMGQEREWERRRAAFAGYQVTPELLARAKPGVIFLHPLPAHAGEEIAPGLLDHPASVVFDQAENRLHVQKAVLAALLRGGPAA